MGHFKRDCWQLKAKDDTNKVTEIVEDSDEYALVVGHTFAARTSADWIIDSGATSHMCTSRHLFTDLNKKVSLGDGRSLKAVGRGTVSLIIKLPGGRLKRCPVKNALHIPDLSYNLISVSKASKSGNMTKFDESGCQIVNSVIATATRCGSLYSWIVSLTSRQMLLKPRKMFGIDI